MGQALTRFLKFLVDYQLAGFILGFLASLGAGIFYDWLKRRNLKAKQQQFIEELNDSLTKYTEAIPENEAEVDIRRQEVKSKVQQLSRNIFGKDSPPIESLRLESTEYPQIDCKWCHRKHKAHHGSRGDCKTCKLPLDIWIGVAASDAPNNSFNRSAS